MALRSVEEYRAGLRDGRRVFVEGRRVEGVTADPMLSITVAHSAEVFALASRPELRGSSSSTIRALASPPAPTSGSRARPGNSGRAGT